MILYSIPQFSGIPIAARLTETLADEPLVMGVKESSGLLPSSLEVLQSPRGMRLYVGSDDMAATLLLAGAAGVISGTANAFPELLVAVRDAIRRGSGVWEAQARLTRAIRTLIRYPVVANMKAVLAARGFPALSVRPPLVDLSPDECATMLGELEPLGVLRPV
jgi:dihydrodipicolinate synthase/N-acetylneuraminate lyase